MTLRTPTMCCVMPMAHITAIGLLVARISAASYSFSIGTRVICATFSGGYCITVALNSSKPSVRSAMNF